MVVFYWKVLCVVFDLISQKQHAKETRYHNLLSPPDLKLTKFLCLFTFLATYPTTELAA